MKPSIARRLLQVDKFATKQEIKIAWKRKMIVHHPDKHMNSLAKVRYCTNLNIAKNTLLNNVNDYSSKKRKNMYYPFDSQEEEYKFWDNIIQGQETLD